MRKALEHPENERELNKVFHQYDSNKEGCLSKEEFSKLALDV